MHLKSKGIFNAYEWSKWWQIADANRRKILAQAAHLRMGFLDGFLSDAATREIPLIVCGDINDGPGLDASEKRLFGSGVERLMGSIWRPDLALGLSPRIKNPCALKTLPPPTSKTPYSTMSGTKNGLTT